MRSLNTNDSFSVALQHHQAGRLAEAEQLYRQILFIQPSHADALHHLGLIALQVGQLEPAAQLIKQSLTIAPDNYAARINFGIVLIRLGQLVQAENELRTVIHARQDIPEAFNVLGNILREKKQPTDALDAYLRAISLRPDYPEALSNLGNAYFDNGKIQKAIECYQKSIAINPKNPDALSNLGNALLSANQIDEAITACRSSLQLSDNNPAAYNNLGNALRVKKEYLLAIEAYRNAIKHNPNYVEAYNNLGSTLYRNKQYIESLIEFQKAINLSPTYAIPHNNMGMALSSLGRLHDAIESFNRALKLKPDYHEAYNNLGNAYLELDHIDDAVFAYQRAIEIQPDYAEPYANLATCMSIKGDPDEAVKLNRRSIAFDADNAGAYNNLANALKDQGLLDQAIEVFEEAAEKWPESDSISANLIYSLQFHPNYDAKSQADHREAWYQSRIKSNISSSFSHLNQPDPDRKLRIGYVSPDFNGHVVGRNILPLIREHDRNLFQIFCYSNSPKVDSFTTRIKSLCDVWRDIYRVSDEQSAEMIRQDKIDILVDLALHMNGSRLSLFAHKPAPIQVTFAGYPGSTGLHEIDYRLSDPYLDPEDADVSVYSEETIRLPNSFWCYDIEGMSLSEANDVGPLPFEENGFVTFGCLNNFCKVNDSVLDLWSKVLNQVADSRLLLLCPEGSARLRVRDFFQAAGIQSHRIDFVPNQPRAQYLSTYRRMDIGLDTFPYNGHTTSLDSIWMGVPVVTLVGNTIVGRAGFSQLSNLGLQELVAFAPEDFIQIVTGLSQDTARLKTLRQSMQNRMKNSPLMDAVRFARDIESVYKSIWKKWCSDVGTGAENSSTKGNDALC